MRPPLMSRSAWARSLGWATLALLALLAAGGAASLPNGISLAAPEPAEAVLVLGGIATLAAAARGVGLAACAGFLPIPLLVLSGARIPGLAALTGPPLFALVLAGAALALATTPVPAWRKRLFIPVALLAHLLCAAMVQRQVGPEGDEPHYLMVAESLLRDGDLSLEQDYAEGRYRAFHPAELAPHYRVRGKDGQIYSLHALGLSLLVLPAYALGGYAAASFFMALLATLVAWQVRELVRAALGRDDVAEGIGWLVALGPPLVHYAGLVFTEVPAALAVVLGLRAPATSGRYGAWLGRGAVLAFLPWLNVRYAPLAAVLFLYALSRRPSRREAAALALPLVVSAAGLAAFHFALYGFFDPRRVYGRRPEMSLAALPEGAAGLLLDQEFGLLVYAPVFVLALPGLVRLWRSQPPRAAAAGALIAAVLVTSGSWHMWRGGFNPPARFLLPVVPALALAVAAVLSRGLRPASAFLIGWTLWTGLAGAAEPRLVHRDRDGTAPLFRADSGAEEWTRLLPGFVLPESGADRRALSLVWTGALALAALSAAAGRGPIGAGRVCLAAGGLLAATAAASSLSHARTAGRDAVRVVGRPAVGLPGWRAIRSAPAVWGPADLDWGPLYEPHRHPSGAALGSRLRLHPGVYRLQLEVEEVSAGEGYAVLEILPCPPLPARQAPMEQRGPGLRQAHLQIQPGEVEVTLAVRGGSPFLLKTVRLEPSQPFPP